MTRGYRMGESYEIPTWREDGTWMIEIYGASEDDRYQRARKIMRVWEDHGVLVSNGPDKYSPHTETFIFRPKNLRNDRGGL